MAQNIKIVFETDTTQLKEADAALAGLTAEEKALVEQAKKVNEEYAKINKTIAENKSNLMDLQKRITEATDPKLVKGLQAQFNSLLTKTKQLADSVGIVDSELEGLFNQPNAPKLGGEFNKLRQSIARNTEEMRDLQVQIRQATEPQDIDRLKRKFNELARETDKLTKEVDDLDKEFDSVFKRKPQDVSKLGGAIKQNNSLLSEATKLAAGFGLAFSVEAIVGGMMELGKAVFDQAANWQVLQARLTSSLGSIDAANAALQQIKEVAAETPFSVNEIADAFAKLAGGGLIATKNELIALTDLASSQSKSIDQLAEAVLDGQRGEFERLKEFGIQASKNGNQVSLTFKGVTTTVQNTQDAIQQAIIGMGKMDGVLGSNAKIAETMTGAVSNLGDSWDDLLRTIGGGGSGVMITVIKAIAAGLEGIKQAFMGNAEALGGFGRYIAVATDHAKQFWSTIEELGKSLWSSLSFIGEFVRLVLDLAGATDKGAEKVSTMAVIFDLLARAFKVAILPFATFLQYLKQISILSQFATNELKKLLNVMGANLPVDNLLTWDSTVKKMTASLEDFKKGYEDAFTRPLGALTENEKALKKLNSQLTLNKKNLEEWVTAQTDAGALENALWIQQQNQLKARALLGEELTEEEKKRLGAELAGKRAVTEADKQRAEAEKKFASESLGLIEIRLKRINDSNRAAVEAAKKAGEELMKAEKDAAKQLEKLRQENAVKAINDSKEANAAKLAIDKSNSLKEIEALKVTEATKAALRAEIERKFALQERDDIAKQQLEDDKNTLDARLQIIEDFADKQSEIVEYLALDGVKTNEEAANELVAIDIQTAERRLDALQMYADGIDQSTEDGVKAFKDAQKQITAADKDLNAKRLKQAQDTQARLLELDRKRSEIQIQVGGIDAQVAEINKIGAAQLAQATAAEDRLAIELDTQEKIRAAYDETFEHSKGLIEQQLELDAKRFDVKGIKEGLAKSKTLYEEQAAVVAKTYDDQIKAAKAAGLDTTKLEQQRYDALKKLAENFKKFSADTWKDALNGISDYVQGFTDTAFQAISSLQQVLQAQADREVEAIERQKEAQEVQKNNANERISLYEKELETATGTRRKDLQNAINFERKKVREAERAQEDLVKKQEDIQRAAAKRQQAIDIAQAVINTAVAVTKTLATLGFPAGVPLAVAVGLAGAAQVAAIKAQRFADGTLAVNGGVEGRDSVPALLMPGEAVIPTKQARKYKPVLEQIMNDKLQIGNLRADFGAEFGAKSSGAALSLAETNARLDNLIQVVDKDRSKVFVTIDENGFNAGVRRGASVTHYLNKRFGANV